MFLKKNTIIPVEVSARHCHLCREDLEKLFGQGAQLQKVKQLSQPADFACAQTVEIVAGSKEFGKVRVVGPLREKTQVEISLTDAVGSGTTPPVRLSGDLQGSAPIVLIGPAGRVDLKEGLIIAQRHLHCATNEAKNLGLRQGQPVSVEIKGPRAVVFHGVEVRVRDDYKLCLHLDTDEGNAAGVSRAGQGVLSLVKYKA